MMINESKNSNDQVQYHYNYLRRKKFRRLCAYMAYKYLLQVCILRRLIALNLNIFNLSITYMYDTKPKGYEKYAKEDYFRICEIFLARVV